MRDVEAENAPSIMVDDEEDVEEVEGESWYGEEIHGGDRFAVIP